MIRFRTAAGRGKISIKHNEFLACSTSSPDIGAAFSTSAAQGSAGYRLIGAPDMFAARMFFVLALGLAPGAALAQAHAHAAPNGGQVQKIGSFEAELVVKGSDAMLYVLDDKEQKVDASKYSATAVVLAKGNEQKTLELKPAGTNMLAAKVDFPVEGKFRATVTLKSGASEVGKGRYSVDLPVR